AIARAFPTRTALIIAPRTAIAGELPTLRWRVARALPAHRRTARRTASARVIARRSAKPSSIATIRCAAARSFTPVGTAIAVAARTIGTIARFGRRRFVLRPLGAEAEALKLAQIEFIEILGGIFLGGRVVHVVG